MPLSAPVTPYGPTAESIAAVAKSPDSVQGPGIPPRWGSRGEQFVYNLWNGMQALAMEGSYYVAATATPGTGIVLSVATGTSFSDTQALVCINNTDTAGTNGRTIHLDFIKVIVTTAPTSASSWSAAHRIDTATRGSNGTQLGAVSTSPRPTNTLYATSAAAQVFALGASAVSVAASTNVRNVGRNTLRGQIPVALDDIVIKFGSAEMAAGGVSISQSTVGGITIYAPPVAIAPGHSYVLNEWATARSAALSGEMVVGWVER